MNRFFPLFLAVFCCFLASQNAHAAAPVATVQTLIGAATIRPASGAASPLRARRPLYQNDVVALGAGTRATLLFRDGAQIRLREKSAVQITASASGGGKTGLLRVLGGEIWGRLRPGNTIQTQTAALGVLGTEINLSVAPDGTSSLAVLEGSVAFSNEFGAVTVGEKQSSVARIGQAPTNPITLDNAGFVVEWTLDLNRAAVAREKFWVSLDRGELEKRLPGATGLMRGDLLFDLGRFEEALAAYAALPDSSETWVRRGYTLLELDHLDEAKRAFGVTPILKTVALDAENDEARAGLAWVELARDRPAVALKIAQSGPHRVSVPSEANGEIALVAGVAALRSGQTEIAGRELKKAEKAEFYARYQATSWLALAKLAQGDPEAVSLARQAVAMKPQSALAHGHLAMTLFFQNDLQNASREAQTASRLNPRLVAARVVGGQIALARGEVDRAEREAAQAVALDPSLPQAHYLLGVAEASRRDYGHARKSLERALELSPDFLPSAAALARVLTLTGQKTRALTLLNDLKPRYGQQDEVLAALGTVSYESGDYLVAGDYFRQAATKKPNSARFQSELARSLLYANRLNEAIGAGEESVRLAPQIGQYHAVLGLAYEFGGLGVQAERSYREAILRDPENSLALTRLAGFADARPGVARRLAVGSDTQAFLFDPAVARQLLRGGVNTEITPVLGSDDAQNFGFAHRLQQNDGKLNAIGFLNRRTEDGSRANQDGRTLGGSAFVTFADGQKSNFYATVRGVRSKIGLSGPEATPIFDDRNDFRYGQAQIALRRRTGARSDVWLGLFANDSRSQTRDPGLNSFLDANSGLPTRSQNFDSNALLPELRYDLRFSDRGSDTKKLSLGLALARTDFSSRRDLQFPIQTSPATQNFSEENRILLGYAAWTQRAGEKVSFSGQLRLQKRERARNSSLILPNQANQNFSNNRDNTLLLPSFVASFRPGKTSLFRASLNRQTTDVTTATFAPIDTLTATEIGASPFGTPEVMSVAQLDYERYFGAKNFLKLFAFSSRANDVVIGGSDLTGLGVGLASTSAPILNIGQFWASGLGGRLESRLGDSLFANFAVLARRTTNDTAGTLFDGGRAPYEPNLSAALGLNYLDRRGNKAGVQLRHAGSFFADAPGQIARQKFGAKTLVDVRLAREANAGQEIFVAVRNVFDADQIAFNDFRVGRRRVEFGVTRRF